MKCKVVKVTVFGYKGRDYKPGDVVDVPKRYATLDFMEPVPEKEKKSTETPARKPKSSGTKKTKK